MKKAYVQKDFAEREVNSMLKVKPHKQINNLLEGYEKKKATKGGNL